METTRQLKVARLIQKEFGSLFQSELQWAIAGNIVSVTVVRISPDLSFARIYLSTIGRIQPAELVQKLEAQKSKIRYIFGQKVKHQLRIVPEFAFYYDDSAAYAANIDALLRKNTTEANTEEEE
jgi:ribosome-binding factor A